ncbi:type II toxin-antitoxin system HipA family toxin [Francisellaceae bacterium]|nr:type II toxin-antitoxin system HipA family toxin [Francisellaceae bacterium]
MNKFIPIQKLEVLRRLADGNKVKAGILAQNKNAVYFQYDSEYLKHCYNLSPFKLSFDGKLQEAIKLPHQGLHGVFADSLPDGWGLLLMDRMFRRHGVLPQQLTMMDRLAYIGNRGMGALEYVPISAYAPDCDNDLIDIHKLGQEAQEIFDGQTSEVLTHLANAGSSGGARPKAQIYIHPNNLAQANTIYQTDLEPWLVKFTSQSLALGHEESLCEAVYLEMAHNAGIV